MAKFNFLAHRNQPTDIKVKQPAKRAPARDPFAGLYGPDYIAANSLIARSTYRVQRIFGHSRAHAAITALRRFFPA